MKKTLKGKDNLDPIVKAQLDRSTFTRVRKVPKMILPKGIAFIYSRELIKLINKQIDIVKSTVINNLPSLVADAAASSPVNDARNDSWSDEADRMLDAMEIGLVQTTNDFKYVAANIGQRTNAWHDKQWQKVMKASLGVNLYGNERWIDDSLKSFTKQNVALITNLTDNTSNEIKNVVMSGIRRGDRAETITKKLLSGTDLQKGVFAKTKTRAKLIAVDQTLTYYAELNEARQKAVGLKQYIWRNSDDERVRGNPKGLYRNSKYNHWDREGKEYSFDKPPADGNPGMAVRCRCYAEPIFDDLLFDEEG